MHKSVKEKKPTDLSEAERDYYLEDVTLLLVI
jgi:hypothetical protein